MSELRYIHIKDPINEDVARVEPNGGLAVNMQDYTGPVVVAKFNQVQNETVLVAESAIDTRVIEVDDATGIDVGSYIIIFSNITGDFYVGTAVIVAGTTITLDNPLNATYIIGAAVTQSITNMNVVGSPSAPEIFGLRGNTTTSVPASFDVTRILFSCTCNTTVDLSKFADLPALTYGMLLRKRNGEHFNIANWKTNLDIAGVMLDWIPYDKTKPNEGQDGFTARLTFTRLGAVIRLAPGEDLEIWVQDDLLTAGTLNIFEIRAEGHIVQD